MFQFVYLCLVSGISESGCLPVLQLDVLSLFAYFGIRDIADLQLSRLQKPSSHILIPLYWLQAAFGFFSIRHTAVFQGSTFKALVPVTG